MEDKDYIRFVHNLYEFNDEERVSNAGYLLGNIDSSNVGCQTSKNRKRLVDIHCFCLMPNHYHLMLSPKVKDGIPLFMKKINMGFAKYFNQKYKRVGALFQGKYKFVLIQNDSYFIHLPYYIHLNPLDLFASEWRERKMTNPEKAIKFLENYRWSSLLDYMGKRNFPSVTYRKFLSSFWGGSEQYRSKIMDWINGMEHSDVASVSLE